MDHRDQDPLTTGTTSSSSSPPAPPLSDPLLSPATTFSSPGDLCLDLPLLLSLSSRGQWTHLLAHISQSRSRSLLSQPPHHHLVYLSFNALALHKLRRYSDASLEIQTLIPFDSPKYLYQTYPDLYPGRAGSMLPFSVRYLHADLPQRLGSRNETLDRLYSLLDFVRHKKSTSTTNICWKQREAFLLSAICSNHFAHKEFDVCFSIVSEILKSDPADPLLVSKLGYMQLQIGDLDGARASFARVAAPGLENLAGKNRALEFMVEKDYVSAAREYDECIGRDPGDVVALNNKALCLMYLRDLSDSIKLLEGALESVPTAAVNETVVVNLCSMYELAYVNHGEVKKRLSSWIAKVAPEDFDSSCTRI